MKHLLFMLLVICSLHGSAQDANTIVKWTFSTEKGSEANSYVLTAKATIEKGWHVFAPNPGGDGLLIPTEIKFTGRQTLKKAGALTPLRKPITKEMESIGMVNYYENEITFTVSFETDKPQGIAGMISFQCCNDKICLPPTEVPFKIKL